MYVQVLLTDTTFDFIFSTFTLKLGVCVDIYWCERVRYKYIKNRILGNSIVFRYYASSFFI